ncbi:hypothetical protein N7492_010299 [Penicillium capsulatum]|uniref:Uncharacterized protein n=1 Tax=Penicillium capsulatum TaxID=69766 RepID=A0A9W9LET4_9EURO|nr:hypothetical protein N7492_010299 [Penicillium capsulatum]KAJ6112805.1 hypothetical protein N7512_008129 [Penicillium capsulatum]
MKISTLSKYEGHEPRWMDSSSKSTLQECKVQKSKLKFKEMEHLAYLGETPYHPVQVDDFGIDRLQKKDWIKTKIVETDPRILPPNNTINKWEGLAAPGVLVIEEIKRKAGPYISEISQAVYERSFSIDTLKRIYILDVRNTDTLNFVSETLYTARNGLEWPDEEIRYWDKGTPEFNALLGTEIGQVVAHIVLGAFDRGTRHISRIGTAFLCDELQLQFELEATPSSPSHTAHLPASPAAAKSEPSEEQKQRLARLSASIRQFFAGQKKTSSTPGGPLNLKRKLMRPDDDESRDDGGKKRKRHRTQ